MNKKSDKKLDKKDLAFLRMLDVDARVPIATVARQLKLTENAIRYRMERLKIRGYLKGYYPKLSSSRFGKNIQVVFSINVRPDSLASSLKKLSDYHEFTKVYRCSGEYSIVCIGFFNDNEHFEEFLNKKMFLEIPVTDWAEHIVLKRYKNDEFNVKMI
ncbi:Lrp/AsnC family transcriptional regulator [Candidatus Woesearchaeota archaeon]|nr:Lrp/AsnC family transcriptional regulator [Candidatus Woesearchaeota archaeon]